MVLGKSYLTFVPKCICKSPEGTLKKFYER